MVELPLVVVRLRALRFESEERVSLLGRSGLVLVNVPEYLNSYLFLLVEEGRYSFCLSELQVR